jgi:hypothetical protein
MSVSVPSPPLPDLQAIIAAEFREMPGLRLTLPQVCRWWNLSHATAESLVRALVQRGLLSLDRRGLICRPDESSR